MLTLREAVQMFEDYGIEEDNWVIEKNYNEAVRQETEDGERSAEHVLEDICDNWPQNA